MSGSDAPPPFNCFCPLLMSPATEYRSCLPLPHMRSHAQAYSRHMHSRVWLPPSRPDLQSACLLFIIQHILPNKAWDDPWDENQKGFRECSSRNLKDFLKTGGGTDFAAWELGAKWGQSLKLWNTAHYRTVMEVKMDLCSLNCNNQNKGLTGASKM